MSESRYFACPGTPAGFKGQGWHIVDRHTGKDAESLSVGGHSEERARQHARPLNLNARLSNVPAFEGNRWNGGGPDDFECLDVLAGPLPGKPIWIGEPIGLVVREVAGWRRQP